MFRQLFTKTPLTLSIARQGNEVEREGNKLDYLPFGVKTLKVVVEGDYKGELRLSPKRPSPVDGEKFAHEDEGTPPQFVVSWGGGYEDYYLLDYPKKRFVYFLVHHIGTSDTLGDRLLTIEARPEGSDEVIASLPVTLTYPTFQGIPWPVEDLVKPAWQEVNTGPSGASDILLTGRYTPDYISRWWPRNRITYETYGSPPPQLRLRYRRQVEDDSGDLTVYAASLDGQEVKLATIQGRIPYPLYDMQQVVPELYRFGPQTWALRVWFFWLDKNISLADLNRYGTRTQDETQQAWQGIIAKTEGGLADKSWQDLHEIPDAERVDIVFSHDLQPLFAATDLHWREMWGRYEKPGEPIQVRIMNTRPAALLQDRQEAWKVAEGWGKILLTKVLPRNQMSPPYNPHSEVVQELAGRGKLAADPIAMESHAPAFLNVSMQVRFTSTDVTEG